MHTTLDDALARELEDFLRQEEAALLEWRSAVQRMRTSMLAGDVEQGSGFLQEETPRMLEQRRKRVALRQRIAQELNVPEGQVCLSMLRDHVDAETRQRLESRRLAMQALLQTVRSVTNANAALVLQTSDVMQKLIEVLSQTSVPCTTYDASGKLTSRIKSSGVRRQF